MFVGCTYTTGFVTMIASVTVRVLQAACTPNSALEKLTNTHRASGVPARLAIFVVLRKQIVIEARCLAVEEAGLSELLTQFSEEEWHRARDQWSKPRGRCLLVHGPNEKCVSASLAVQACGLDNTVFKIQLHQVRVLLEHRCICHACVDVPWSHDKS